MMKSFVAVPEEDMVYALRCLIDIKLQQKKVRRINAPIWTRRISPVAIFEFAIKPSVDRIVLKKELQRQLNEKHVIWLLDACIQSFEFYMRYAFRLVDNQSSNETARPIIQSRSLVSLISTHT